MTFKYLVFSIIYYYSGSYDTVKKQTCNIINMSEQFKKNNYIELINDQVFVVYGLVFNNIC